jgi:hypothetical protein
MPAHHPPASMDEDFDCGKLNPGAGGFDLPSGMPPVPRLFTLDFMLLMPSQSYTILFNRVCRLRLIAQH